MLVRVSFNRFLDASEQSQASDIGKQWGNLPPISAGSIESIEFPLPSVMEIIGEFSNGLMFRKHGNFTHDALEMGDSGFPKGLTRLLVEGYVYPKTGEVINPIANAQVVSVTVLN